MAAAQKWNQKMAIPAKDATQNLDSKDSKKIDELLAGQQEIMKNQQELQTRIDNLGSRLDSSPVKSSPIKRVKAEEEMKVTVLGAGNGGYALAFHLSGMGHKVCLYEHPDFASAVEPVTKSGEIHALEECDGSVAQLAGTSKIDKTTTSIEESIKYADVIMAIVPAFGQGPLFKMALPFLEENKLWVSLPGGWASLEYAQIMEDEGMMKKLTFVESSTIPYACRKVKGNQVFISGLKKGMQFGVFPSNKTKDSIEKIRPLFSNEMEIRVTDNVLGPGMMNNNITYHPATTLFNTGWIEHTKGNFKFYSEGFTPSIAKLAHAVDEERVMVCKKMGNKECLDALNNDKFWYGQTDDKDMYEYNQNAPHFKFFQAPPSLDNRYVTEDLGYSFLPIIRYLAPACGVECKVMNAIVTCAEALLGRKLQCARNFKFIQKEGEDLQQMMKRLDSW